MLEQTIKILWAMLLFCGAVFVVLSSVQLDNLEKRVTAIEEARPSWDIIIDIPTYK